MTQNNDIVCAYCHSDEIIFVHRTNATLHKYSKSQLESSFADEFTAKYISSWPQWFGSVALRTNPVFRATVTAYATPDEVEERFNDEQCRAHEKNLYTTVFWNLVLHGKRETAQAESELLHATVADRNECLFKEFGINYNNEPVRHKKGTILLRKCATIDGIARRVIVPYNRDMANGTFWNEHSELFANQASSFTRTDFVEIDANNQLIRMQIHRP